MFSQSYACPEHGVSVEELTPRMFSFNNPFGACEKCTGLGTFMKVDPARVIPDKRKSIRESAIKASGWYYAEGSIARNVPIRRWASATALHWIPPLRTSARRPCTPCCTARATSVIEMQRESMFGSGTLL